MYAGVFTIIVMDIGVASQCCSKGQREQKKTTHNSQRRKEKNSLHRNVQEPNLEGLAKLPVNTSEKLPAKQTYITVRRPIEVATSTML